MTALVRRDATLVPAPAVAAASDAAATEAPARVRKFIASNESVDSYNSVIKASGWDLEQYTRNPVVALFHNTYGRFPVAKGRVYIEGSQLMLEADFAPADDPVSGPDAEQALRWFDRGLLGVSVGFEPLEYEYNADRETGDEWVDMWCPPIDYTRQRLLEVSVVMLPANPDALPVGRSLTRAFASHTVPRVAQQLAAKAAAPATPAPSSAVIRKLVQEVTAEEVAAIKAQRAGNLRGKRS